MQRLKDRLSQMDKLEIKKMIQEKSPYGFYIIRYENGGQKEHIKGVLKDHNMYGNDHTSSQGGSGYLFYSPRKLKKRNDDDYMPEFVVYSSGDDFMDNGDLDRLYYDEDIDRRIIKYDDFFNWLENYLTNIFGYNAKHMYKPRKFLRENMKKVKKYNEFLNEKKIPKISIDIKDLLSVLDKSKHDIFRTFRINKDEVGVRGDIDQLYSNKGFNNNLKKNDLKHGKLQNTQYNETLLDEKYVLKFFFIYDKDSIELEEPQFIVLQYYNTDTDERSDILGFSNTDNINSFYEKLTDATIELKKGDDTYIYQTSNGGNNWEMKNVQMEDEEMKGTLDKKELQKVIDKNKFDVSHE